MGKGTPMDRVPGYLFGIVLLVSVPVLAIVWLGGTIDAAIGTTGLAAVVAAVVWNGLGIGLWLYRLMLLVQPFRRWLLRAWFWQALWGFGLLLIGNEQWLLFQASGEFAAGYSAGAALLSLVGLLLGFRHVKPAAPRGDLDRTGDRRPRDGHGAA